MMTLLCHAWMSIRDDGMAARHAVAAVFLLVMSQALPAAEPLKVHGIFRSNMVLQREKPIVIWGWAPVGTEVEVAFGDRQATSKADGDRGRWEVTFPPQPANSTPQNIIVKAGDSSVQLENILMGDVWVMNGQSNMAFALRAVYEAPLEASMAHLPLLRHIRINSGAESEHLETDLQDQFINGKDEDKNWKVVTPEVALESMAFPGSRYTASAPIISTLPPRSRTWTPTDNNRTRQRSRR